MPLDNPKSDFSKWYSEILLRGDIVDARTPIKGANVILPNGYTIWESIKRFLDQQFEATDHKNAYFPLFIPEEFLLRESEHFEGFVPEVAWVTRVGDRELNQKLALRPTSETIMYHMYAQWIKDHSDLPIKYNQWANIIRMDTKETRPLLRDREFQWSEAHTCHAKPEEAVEQVKESMLIYQALFDALGLSYLVVRRPKFDTFPGADYSIAYDAPLTDGRVLQIGTTHNLGQSFAKVFHIKYTDKDGKSQLVYQTCYGVSTRVLAAIIALHGDDQGLILPPKFAPIQIGLVPIFFKEDSDLVKTAIEDLTKELKKAGYKAKADIRESYTAGWKFAEFEMKGVPIRLEIGPRDLKNDSVMLVRRDTGEKQSVKRSDVKKVIKKVMIDIAQNLKMKADDILQQMLHQIDDFEALKKLMSTTRGIAISNWCGEDECAENIKEETSADIRGVREDIEEKPTGPCIVCLEEGKFRVYIAQAY
jgi:prolyl-tRNA synthetase